MGSYEAKTRLAELLKRVEAGERITIIRHGKDVAVLSPPPGGRDRTVDEAVRGLLEFRKEPTPGRGLSVRDLVEEGRRG